MKLQILTKTLPAVVLLLTIVASSANADDHYYDRHRRGNRHHHRGSGGVNIELAIPGVVDVYSPRRERVVIVEHNRRYSDGNRVEFEVQRGLARNGYYRGPIDGDVGYGTRTAIRTYQLDYGLAPTGYIDSELLISLRLR